MDISEDEVDGEAEIVDEGKDAGSCNEGSLKPEPASSRCNSVSLSS